MKRKTTFLIRLMILYAIINLTFTIHGHAQTYIDDVDDLIALSQQGGDITGNYVQRADIIFNEDPTLVDWNGDGSPDGANPAGFRPIADGKDFKGIYNGGGFVIKNVYIRRPPSNTNNIGLFASVNEGTLENINVVDIDIDVSDNDRSSIGGLVGYIEKGDVINCHSSGRVQPKHERAGGLIGTSLLTTITNCSSSADVVLFYEGTEMPSVYDDKLKYIGGLIGYSLNNTISNSFASGMIYGVDWVGSFLGYSDNDDIDNCYGSGAVYGGVPNGDNSLYRVGSFVGETKDSDIDNVYTSGNYSLSADKSSDIFWDQNSGTTRNNYFIDKRTLNEGLSNSSPFLNTEDFGSYNGSATLSALINSNVSTPNWSITGNPYRPYLSHQLYGISNTEVMAGYIKGKVVSSLTDNVEIGYRYIDSDLVHNKDWTYVPIPNNIGDDINHPVSITVNPGEESVTGYYYVQLYVKYGNNNQYYYGDMVIHDTEEVGLERFPVKYDLNGGVGNVPDITEYLENSTVTITDVVPTRTDYTFYGWQIDVETANFGTITIYNALDFLFANNTFAMPPLDVTLTAQWEIIWIACEDDTWSEATNWSTGTIPTAVDNVRIPYLECNNYPVIVDDENASAKTLTIEAGARLTLGSGVTADPDGEFDKGGSLIVVDGTTLMPESNGRLDGMFITERSLSPNRIHYISSPVENADFNTSVGIQDGVETSNLGLDVTNTYDNLWDFDQVTNYASNWNGTNLSGVFEPGIGYVYNKSVGSDDVTIRLIESPNEGVYQIPVEYKPGGNGQYILGNPYTSTISIGSLADASNNFLDQNAGVFGNASKAIFIWDQQTNGYNGETNYYKVICENEFVGCCDADRLQGEYIMPFQGFVIMVGPNNERSSDNVVFNPSIKKHDGSLGIQSPRPTKFYKKDNGEYINNWPGVQLFVISDDVQQTFTLIGVDESATEGIDKGLDVMAMKTNPIVNVYSYAPAEEKTQLSVQGIPRSVESVRVGVDVWKDGDFTFEIFQERMNHLYLEDVVAGKIIDLNKEDYTVALKANVDYQDRFLLHFDASALSNEQAVIKQESIYSYDNTVVIEGVSGEYSIIALDGKIIETSVLSGQDVHKELKLPVGVYIVTTNNLTKLITLNKPN